MANWLTYPIPIWLILIVTIGLAIVAAVILRCRAKRTGRGHVSLNPQSWLISIESSPFVKHIINFVEGITGCGTLLGILASILHSAFPSSVVISGVHDYLGGRECWILAAGFVASLSVGIVLALHQKWVCELKDLRVAAAVAGLYAPLSASSSLAGLVAKIQSGIWPEAGAVNGEQASLLVHPSGNTYHINVHSEVLYYSLLCSLLERFSCEIRRIDRSHIVLPEQPSAFFLPEIIRILAAAPHPEVNRVTQNKYYLFRNDVTDYCRPHLMINGSKDSLGLWETFAKSSRLLLMDQHDGAPHYGYLGKAASARLEPIEDACPQIRGWAGRYEQFRAELTGDPVLVISAEVNRDHATYSFKNARITLGIRKIEVPDAPFRDDAPAENLNSQEAFFAILAACRSHMRRANDWSSYPRELALLSGDEIERQSAPQVLIHLVDDYQPGWQDPGNPREIVWRKTQVALQKRAKVRRIFLVDQAALASAEKDALDFVLTLAEQGSVLQSSGPSDECGVRVLEKRPEYMVGNADGSDGPQAFPDYGIILDHRTNRIIGGVAAQPSARYVNADDTLWRTHFERLWAQGTVFANIPSAFEGVFITAKRLWNSYDKNAKSTRISALVEGSKRQLQEWEFQTGESELA